MKNCSFLHPQFLLLKSFFFRSNIKHSTQCFHHQMKHLGFLFVKNRRFDALHNCDYNTWVKLSSSCYLHLYRTSISQPLQTIHHYYSSFYRPSRPKGYFSTLPWQPPQKKTSNLLQSLRNHLEDIGTIQSSKPVLTTWVNTIKNLPFYNVCMYIYQTW